MQEGVILQAGSPRQIYNQPHNLFVADFIGDRNIKQVRILEKAADHYLVALGDNAFAVAANRPDLPGDVALLAVHKDKMSVSCTRTDGALTGIVESIHYAGSQIRTQLAVAGEMITVIEYLKNECDYTEGEQVYVTWESSAAILLALEDYTEGPNAD